MQRNEEALISVIIPVYNVSQYLDKCIQTVIHQTYRNLEIILVDDGSTDDSGRICDEYAEQDKRIKVIHKNNGGLSDARNAGLDLASGDYIGFIDSDDWVDTLYFEKMIELAVDNSLELIVCGSKKTINENEIVEKQALKPKVIDKYNAQMAILYRKNVSSYVHGKLYKKGLIGLLRFPKNRLFEDITFVWNVVEQIERVGVVEESLYFYRQRADSIVNQKFNVKKMDQLYFWEEVAGWVQDKQELLRGAQHMCFFAACDLYTQVDDNCLKEKQYLEAAIDKYKMSILNNKNCGLNVRILALIACISKTMLKLVGRGYKVSNKIKWKLAG